MQLSDAQVMTLAFAIIFPLAMLIYSNSRIGDVKADLGAKVNDAKETLRAETGKLAVELRSEMKDLRSEMKDLRNEMALLRKDMNSGFERIENAMKVHVLEHHE
jgi:trans-2-enoyl-CoA reductase